MKNLPGVLLLSVALTVPVFAADPQPLDKAEHMPTAPYLLPGAPTLDMTIGQFREKYNLANPQLPLREYSAIDTRDEKSDLTRAATKINETLYSSTALEPGTGKIKTLQITWLPIPGPDQSASQAKALDYMTAMLRFFVPGLTQEEGRKSWKRCLKPVKAHDTMSTLKAHCVSWFQITGIKDSPLPLSR